MPYLRSSVLKKLLHSHRSDDFRLLFYHTVKEVRTGGPVRTDADLLYLFTWQTNNRPDAGTVPVFYQSLLMTESYKSHHNGQNSLNNLLSYPPHSSTAIHCCTSEHSQR